MKGSELKKFIGEKYNHYRSSPQGCIDYIQECLKVAMPGVGYSSFRLWETQQKMVYDIVDCMFNPRKDMYVVLGSRQCGKTSCVLAISDWVTTFFKKYNVVLIHVDDIRGKSACDEFRKMRSEKTKLMWLPTKKNALTNQIFSNDSSFKLQSSQKSKTGASTDTGRGLSVNLLWIDEAAAVDLEKLEAAVFPTTSTTFTFCKQNNIPHIILLTSTANGRVGIGKRYYDLWKSVEPPHNMENESMGGYLLYWKDIPGKDEKWYESQARILTPRKLHQEVDCVFYGAEQSLFTDEQVEKIQLISSGIKHVEPNWNFVTSSGYVARGTFFSRVKRARNYLIGVDMAKGRGQDATAVEVLDFETIDQVFEMRDQHIQHSDFVESFDSLVREIISRGGNVLISIEDNMTGSSVVSDLVSLNPIYRTLIYRDTISEDISRKSNQMTPYSKCHQGVNITRGTRDILIDCIFRFIENSMDRVKSDVLAHEIESLEVDEKGKVMGTPHDDTVFALGHCLLVKSRGRIANVLSIFRYCTEVRDDNDLLGDNKKEPGYSGFEKDGDGIILCESGLMSYVSESGDRENYGANGDSFSEMNENVMRMMHGMCSLEEIMKIRENTFRKGGGKKTREPRGNFERDADDDSNLSWMNFIYG